MELIKAKYKNYRIFEDEEIIFPKNEALVIHGENGSGKSSILYGIVFNLYGWSPFKNVESVLKRGTKKGSVELEFKIDGILYKTVREFNKRGTNFSIYQMINGEFEAIGGEINADAEEALRQIFPVTLEVFLRVVIRLQPKTSSAEEFKLGYLCSATPARFYKAVKSFVDVAMAETLQDKTKEVIRKTEDELIQIKSVIDTSKKTIEDMNLAPTKPEVIEQFRKEVNDLKKDRDKAQKAYNEAQKLDEQKKKFDKAQKILVQYSDIEKWYNDWQDVKNATEPKVRYNETAIVEKQEKIKKLQEELQMIPGELETLQKELLDLRKGSEKLIDEIQDKKSNNQKVNKEIELIEERIKLLESGECDRCNRRFNSVDKHIKKAKSEIEEWAAKKIDLAPLKEKKNSQTILINEKDKAISTLQNKKISLSGSISSLREDITKIESSKSATEAWDKKNDFLKNYPYENNPENIYQSVIQAKAVEDPKKEPEDVNKLKTVFEELDDLYVSKSNSLESMIKKDEQFRYHNDKMMKYKDRIPQLEKDLKNFRDLVDLYGRNGVPFEMMQNFLGHLEYYSNIYLGKLTYNRFSMKFVPDSKGDVRPVFYDARFDNHETDYVDFSGGEATRIALAVEVLGWSEAYEKISGVKIDSCLLDEVYGMDEKGQDEYAKALKEMAGLRKVISGIACFKSAADFFEGTITVEDGRILQ